MTYTLTCDYCSGTIESGDGFVKLTVKGEGTRQGERDTSDEWSNGWIAHYHDACMGTVRDMLCLIRDAGAELESIPTIRREPASADRRSARGIGQGHDQSPPSFYASSLPVTGEMSIEETITHPPTASALRRAGIRTLEEAAERTEFDLLGLDRVGPGTVARLVEAMAAHGLSPRRGADPARVGKRIAALRRRAGLSQPDLVLVLDPGESDSRGYVSRELSQGTIADWESGRRAPSRDWLAKIAEYFGITVDEVLMGLS